MGQGAVAAGIYAVLTVPGAEDDPRPAILIAAPAQPAAEQPAAPLDQPAEQPADQPGALVPVPQAPPPAPPAPAPQAPAPYYGGEWDDDGWEYDDDDAWEYDDDWDDD